MATTSPDQFEKAWAQIIAKSWSDAAYRQTVEANPAAALKAAGIDIPPGLVIRVNGSGPVTDNSAMVLPFPARPSNLQAGAATSGDTVLAAGSSSSSSLVSSSCCP
jgi:hypothetical protein